MDSIISSYNLLEMYNKIAENYFTIEPSKQRIGMYGYITESMARSTAASILNSKFRSSEALASTAQYRYTLLLIAAALHIDVPNANPALMETFIGIPLNDVINRGIPINQDIEFILDKDTVFNISGLDFMLEYDLRIYAKKVLDDYTFSSQYVMTTDNDISDLTNPYLLTTRQTDLGVEYIFVKVTLRQMTKTYAYHNVIENDDINLIGIEFPYDDQLAYFNIWYKEANKSSYQKITAHNILDKSRPNEKYLLYDTSNDGIITISSDTSFRPSFNSDIRIDIFTTKGSSGNFSYKNGQISISLNSYEDSRDYSGVYLKCTPLTDSVNGKNMLSLEELRNEVIYANATLGGLDTDVDLNIYFKKMDKDNSMIFIKKRSDIMERRFTAYMIPRTDSGDIIPTATMNLDYNKTDFNNYYSQTGRYIIKANSKFSLATADKYLLSKNIKTYSTDAEIYNVETNGDSLLFGTPYLIVVNTQPESISYFHNSISNKFSLKSSYINGSTLNQFVINSFNINRSAVLGEDTYKIILNVMPNSSTVDILDGDGNIKDSTMLVVKGIIYDGAVALGYINFELKSYNKDGNYFVYESKMDTDDYLSMDNKLRIINSIYPANTAALADTLVPGTDLKMEFAVYYKEALAQGKSSYDTIIPNMTNYTLTNVYSNANNPCDLFVDMTDIIRSTVTLPSADKFLLKEVPLVRYSYLQKYASYISEIISKSKANLDVMNELITNNFSIDFKFYRTYGASNYFKADGTTLLNTLSLTMIFDVILKPLTSQTNNTSIINSIKLYIKQFIEKMNIDSNDGEASLYFSNITTAVENQYKEYLSSIEISKLNSFTVTPRKILYSRKPLNNMTTLELRDYVPEYLNIPIENITLNIK